MGLIWIVKCRFRSRFPEFSDWILKHGKCRNWAKNNNKKNKQTCRQLKLWVPPKIKVGGDQRSEGEVLGTSGWKPQGGCQVFLAAERVLAIVDGVTQLLQHHVQGSVLGQLHHEHTRLHANVARVRLTCRDNKNRAKQHQPFDPFWWEILLKNTALLT